MGVQSTRFSLPCPNSQSQCEEKREREGKKSCMYLSLNFARNRVRGGDATFVGVIKVTLGVILTGSSPPPPPFTQLLLFFLAGWVYNVRDAAYNFLVVKWKRAYFTDCFIVN